MIDLKEAINILESGNWCSVDYVGYDRKQKKYGHIVRIPKCRIQTKSNYKSGQQVVLQKAQVPESKSQNHSEHFTRNVYLPNGEIRKLHLRLVFQINNQRIL